MLVLSRALRAALHVHGHAAPAKEHRAYFWAGKEKCWAFHKTQAQLITQGYEGRIGRADDGLSYENRTMC